MKIFLILLFQVSLTRGFSQTGSFDVFTYRAPDYFITTELSEKVQWSLINNDTSFCHIILYKSQAGGKDASKDLQVQWNAYVRKSFNKSNKKPIKILTGQMCDGWTSSLAIGNFNQNKKNCVVMLYSFRKDQTSACAVYAFSDKIFKGPIESFSKDLHLTTAK